MIDRDNEYFLCAVEERNLARAEPRLGVSQSALTRAVQRLEARHGLKLLERAPRGVEPTAAGALLARSLREMAARAETTARQLRDLAGGRRGEVRVGVGQTIARRVREALLPRLLQDRPGATLQRDTGLNSGRARRSRARIPAHRRPDPSARRGPVADCPTRRRADEEAFVADTLRGGDASMFARSDFGPRMPGASYRNFRWLSHDAYDGFLAVGRYGQRIYVAPRAALTIVHFGSMEGPPPHPNDAALGRAYREIAGALS